MIPDAPPRPAQPDPVHAPGGAAARGGPGPQPPAPRVLPGWVGPPSRLTALTRFSPPEQVTACGVLLCLPPLDEEATRARATIAAQARRLAASGWHVEILDLPGCGDSTSGLGAASLEGWLEQARWRAEAWRAAGIRPWVWGVRAGALLAGALARRHPGTFQGVLAWSPLASGEAFADDLRRRARLRRMIGAAVGPEWPAALLGDLARLRDDDTPGARIVVASLSPYWSRLEPEDDSALFEQTERALASLGPRPVERPAGPLLPPDLPATDIAWSGPDGVVREQAIVFPGPQGALTGVVAMPSGVPARSAVLLVAGRPQTRVGANRMFVRLARELAMAGHAAMRFDFAGHGDSDGDAQGFEQAGADVHAAIRALTRAAGPVPVVLWGLCDGACAALLAAPNAPSPVAGVVLVNPWLPDPDLRERAQLGTYYGRRMRDPAAWRRLLRGEMAGERILEALGVAWRRMRAVIGRGIRTAEPRALHQRMAEAVRAIEARIDVVLAADDVTAGAFDALLHGRPSWRSLARTRLHVHRVPRADHVFVAPAAFRALAAHTRHAAEAAASAARAGARSPITAMPAATSPAGVPATASGPSRTG